MTTDHEAKAREICKKYDLSAHYEIGGCGDECECNDGVCEAAVSAIASALKEADERGIEYGVRFVMTSSEIYSNKQTEGAEQLLGNLSWLSFQPDRVKPGELLPRSSAHREARVAVAQRFAIRSRSETDE